MGQSSSRGVSSPAEQRSTQPSPTPRRISRALDARSTSGSQPASRPSAHGLFSFSRLRSDRSDAGSSAEQPAVFRRRSRLSRAHSSISSILSRPRSSSRSRDRPPRPNPHRFSSPFWPPQQVLPQAVDPPSSPLPRLQMPELGVVNFDDFTPENLDTHSLLSTPPPQVREQDAEPERQTSLQRSNSILDRVAGSVVPDRSGGRMRNSLRRRRSPLQQGEDNAAMLSRLLSVAAAATAATLMGEDHRAGAEARNFVGGDEDGTFDGFLQSLQNGRIASALRGHTAGIDVNAEEPGPPAPLNFFRMFRFGSSTGTRRDHMASRPPGSRDSSDESSSAQRADEDGSESRSARRNGVVEPDHAPGEGPRSWIIYVLGGSYPENHPILTTPSLFTDTPTYEDMMLLSTLLGPAKPPVASESDVSSAGGVYTVREASQIEGESGSLVAAAVEGDETIVITPDQRCLVCLCEYQTDDEARKLIKCGHLFHKECIDQWLTTGRNSCPLCRGQGVEEHEKRPTAPATPEMPATPTMPTVA
ncbi:Zinc finger RING-type protein [Neofusicoccum parvum]|uniref:Zinc finger RING-type protein n=1 Tax=Neofusicoccum parvum TaxID=310453 RepID=A0ACB5SFY8_9PEZI|nr:Zinc finger RING-type protein [Neofusicoccum parvum]